jgi:polysaccharide biosynthesis/export protein
LGYVVRWDKGFAPISRIPTSNPGALPGQLDAISWSEDRKMAALARPAGRRMSKGLKLICLATLFLAVSAWAQDEGGEGAAKPPKSGAADTQITSESSDYVIGADDTLHISVWKEPDLSATLPVRPDGKISMPLLDDVVAAGLTPMQLAASIREKLKKYIADPRVTVVVTAMNSRRIFVTGEVTHPGAMPLLPNMTMLQALSSAGFTQFANLKGIYLLRSANGRQEKLPFNYKQVVKGDHPEENIFLKPGDTIVVP